MKLETVLKSRVAVSEAGSKTTRILVTGIFLLTASFTLRSAASVYTLPSGGSITPVSSAFPTGGTVQDTVTSDFTTSTLNGSVVSTVYSGDPSNPYGGLTFTYLVTLLTQGSTDAASELTAAPFRGFQTDVSYNDSNGGVVPFNFSRTGGPVDTLQIAWSGPEINPGQESALIVVQTDAKNFQTGPGGVIDSFPANVSLLVPVPEPAMSGLLVTGLGALLVFRRRNSK